MNSSLNIILFGEMGDGKSSVINLIAGKEIAGTSPDATVCTTSSKPYKLNVDGRNITFWDTVGLQRPEIGVDEFLPAIEQAGQLVHHLRSQGGVDLLLFCIHGNAPTQGSIQRNYRLFYEVLCRSQVPIALVITHLEREIEMEDWWMRNQESLQKWGIEVAGHACVTGLPRHRRYDESRANIRRLLDGQNGDYIMPRVREGWPVELLRFLAGLGLLAHWKRESQEKEIVRVLTKRCGLDQKMAEEIVDKLEAWNYYKA